MEIVKGGECETLYDLAKELKAEGLGVGQIERNFNALTRRSQLGNPYRDAYERAVGDSVHVPSAAHR